MALLFKAGIALPLEVKVTSEEDIKNLIGADFLDVIPLGNDPKKPINKTVWLNEDRDILELKVNEQATKMIDELTTPTEEARTHRVWAVDEEGNEVSMESKTDVVTGFPPIRGDIIITELSVDGL